MLTSTHALGRDCLGAGVGGETNDDGKGQKAAGTRKNERKCAVLSGPFDHLVT